MYESEYTGTGKRALAREKASDPDGADSVARLTVARVAGRKEWTESLFSLRVYSPDTPYKAGQFIKLGLRDSKGELVRRAYSIVNHPDEHAQTGELEFLIITDPKGCLSPMLHSLSVGDPVYVGKEAAGFMTLDEVPVEARDLWLLSTGTAIGPFISMLKEQKIGHRFNQLVLVHAVRYAEDLVYQQEISQLKQKYPGKFEYVPIVSRESRCGALSGRIPHLLGSGELERAACVPLSKTESFIYLCGNPAMVKDSGDTLKAMGYLRSLRRKPGHFSSENYW